MSRRILVTGASGLLGGAVAGVLAGQGHFVRTLQRRPASVSGLEFVAGSITNRTAVDAAMAGMDAVVHLAAKVSFTGEWSEFQATNIEGTRNVLDAARAAGVRDVVFVSSPSVAHFGEPIAGAGAGTADPGRARGHYARSKAAAELLALAEDSPGFRVAAIRPHIVWGPGDTQLVERVMDRARSGRLPLLDGGAALIDTTYLDNASAAIARALDRMEYARGQALVVTNGQPRMVREMISGICAAAGIPAPSFSVPGWLARGAGSVLEKAWLAAGARGLVEDEPPMTRFLAEQLSTSHWFDQRHTRQVLDWQPEVSVEEGMARLAKHYAA
ncbi:NAD-dependent epimerase/dehydratase family protein [Arthrobacter caoxuetaonis]|uniref:NAD-dependent epimerase/dehydratase family protein n=1 Tax=Arthrobacter caoxuetaonis TaxID=2886935 RepID=A0A9X1SC08_9MICC|nr:NAD-dependent epimerase/dehydratase family protein [Arthrobacter caoxuetaonis]MCC3297628.1 NAD-dependent epimerase/dehydratase family protein [Arthrobacter caoxuetaonis]USQ56165.1 NAD-dependent epimerase/dehydratase family protein [Arthrobacter caoxuetaonis]